MQTLYPQIKPYARHDLAVEAPHVLYVDESGSPEGLPVLFIHGGPGAGCDAQSRCYFDPNLYRIVTFDQRGCGRSTPHASLENNTTQALIEDIERIREHLNIEKWVLFGGSWGSTLALAYAQTHPERVHGLILRGIFLCRPQEIEWFYQAGASRLFPDYWQDYIAPIPADERDDLVKAFHKRLTGNDQIAQMHAAKAWSTWEGRTATLRPNPLVVDRFSEPQRALSIARIECHYFMNNAFLEPDQLIRDMPRIAHLPAVIVHGLVVVATDHEDIMAACQKHGIAAHLTNADHPSGTDRIAEVAAALGLSDDTVVVNVQGDEPLIDPVLIADCAAQVSSDLPVATAAHPISAPAELFDPNVVKVVCDQRGRALYFSRAPHPWSRDGFAQSTEVFPTAYTPLRHIACMHIATVFCKPILHWASRHWSKSRHWNNCVSCGMVIRLSSMSHPRRRLQG